jgi:hypothetical protein
MTDSDPSVLQHEASANGDRPPTVEEARAPDEPDDAPETHDESLKGEGD